MNSNELKELVKKHFSLVEADAVSEETITEEFNAEAEVAEGIEVKEETFGELADINDAFILRFPGDSLQIGDKVTVVTSEGQELDAPDGMHELKDGTKIETENSVVTKIDGADGEKAMSEEAMAEHNVDEVVEDVVEKVLEEVSDEMMEEKVPSTEDIVTEIVSAISEEMGYVKKKMAELEAKMEKMEAMPAADPIMKKGPATVFKSESKAKFAAFDVSSAKNSDRIESAIRMMKSNKK